MLTMKWKVNSRCAVADIARQRSGFKFDDEQTRARLTEQAVQMHYFHAA
jgi:hypothetical protein